MYLRILLILCVLSPGYTLAQSASLPSELLGALPVFDWLVVGQSTTRSVKPGLENLNGALVDGTFAYTGGRLYNVASLTHSGIEGEGGLRMMSLGFDRARILASVQLIVERGFREEHVESFVSRWSQRYRAYAEPIVLSDPRGDSLDRYVLFDLGRYVAEIRIPQFGTFFQATYATREVYEEMKKADGTGEFLVPLLTPMH